MWIALLGCSWKKHGTVLGLTTYSYQSSSYTASYFPGSHVLSPIQGSAPWGYEDVLTSICNRCANLGDGWQSQDQGPRWEHFPEWQLLTQTQHCFGLSNPSPFLCSNWVCLPDFSVTSYISITTHIVTQLPFLCFYLFFVLRNVSLLCFCCCLFVVYSWEGWE